MAIAERPPPRAVAFDLNGTISHDEELYFEIFAELFRREGKPVTRTAYYEDLVGHVTFGARLTLVGADDASPGDNALTAPPTLVARGRR